MKTIIYTCPENIINEVDILQQALELGVDYLRLYKPKQTLKQKKEVLAKIDKSFLPKIIVDEFELFNANPTIGALHFFEGTIKYSKFFDIFKDVVDKSPSFSSASCHTISQAKRYRSDFTFLMFSPIFDTNSKNKSTRKLNLEVLKEYFSLKKSKSINFALGGITPNNISNIKEVGFDGVAAMGYIWKKDDPLDNIKRILEKCR